VRKEDLIKDGGVAMFYQILHRFRLADHSGVIVGRVRLNADYGYFPVFGAFLFLPRLRESSSIEHTT
jgi:hypothetical protein